MDNTKVKLDLVHIVSVKGLLGRAVADLAFVWDKTQRYTTKIKAVQFNKVLIEMKNGQKPGKNSDEGIWTVVRMTPEYADAVEQEDTAKRDYWRFANLHRDLENLENALKKILDHGRDA